MAVSKDILSAVTKAAERIQSAVDSLARFDAITEDGTATPEALVEALTAMTAALIDEREARYEIRSLTQMALEGLDDEEAAQARAEIMDARCAPAQERRAAVLAKTAG